MNYSIKKFEDVLDNLARIITERPDGERFVPIYCRIEREIAIARTNGFDLDRIRNRALNSQDTDQSIAA